MKQLCLWLLLLAPTVAFSQETPELEGYKYMGQTSTASDPERKKFEKIFEPDEDKMAPAGKCDQPEEYTLDKLHLEPDSDNVDNNHVSRSIYDSTGVGTYVYTATECKVGDPSQSWSKDMLILFRSYISELGLEEEEFVQRYCLSTFYNPQE